MLVVALATSRKTPPKTLSDTQELVPKKVVLDVDPGVDDALAILLAMRSPELDVRGLTVVNGNLPLIVGVQNALKIVEYGGRPNLGVYAGAAKPLCREPFYATEFHGSGGLGDLELPTPTVQPAGDAVDFLIQQLRKEPMTTLVAVAPLTNLALAERREPGILRRAADIVVMGGAIVEAGNVTPCAEFNFYVDPEAAQTVIESGATVTIIPLDATHQVELAAEDLRRLMIDCPTVDAQLCAAATRPGMRRMLQLYGREAIHLHDPLAVAYAIDSSLCQLDKAWIAVETEGTRTRGQLICDRRVYADDDHRVGSRAVCARSASGDRVIDLFTERVLLGGPTGDGNAVG